MMTFSERFFGWIPCFSFIYPNNPQYFTRFIQINPMIALCTNNDYTIYQLFTFTITRSAIFPILRIQFADYCNHMSSSRIQSIGPYEFHGDIGDGAFSVVRLCQKRGTGEYLACKIVEKKRLNTPQLQSRFELEVRINQQLHHPGIVQMLDLYGDEKRYYMFQEFCPHKDLFQYIVDRGRLTDEESKPIFRQLLEAIKYVHSMGVSHRDLKPENVLIGPDGKIKISDFGLSRFRNSQGLVDTPCGSPCYASPECISGRSYNGITTDVWSCGVILYAMLTGQLPWTKRNQTQLFQQIRRGEYTVPSYVSEEAKTMIKKLMTVDIKARYTVDQALADPWLADVPQQFDKNEQKGYVSLREVDRYFLRDIPDLDVGRELANQRSNSAPKMKWSRLARLLGAKGRKHKHRRRKREGEEDGDRRRRKHRRSSSSNESSTSDQDGDKKRHSARRTRIELPTVEPPRRRTDRRRGKVRPPSAAILQSQLTSKPPEKGKTASGK